MMKQTRKNTLLAVLLFCISVGAFAQKTIPASDPNIQIIGRVDDSDPDNVLFSYPGVHIQATFEGTSLSVLLDEYGSGGTTTTNYFNVIIDGGEPTVLQLSSTETVYSLAEGLDEGTHTVQLFKRTESSVGKVGFKGFQVDETANLLTPEALPEKKMLFIGNSITCGYGNEIETNDPNNFHFTAENENNYNAWGAITARNLDAQYHCVAFSGRGLMQNNNGSKKGIAPVIFNRIFPDDEDSEWDHSKYTPDVVVINLGTNDFSAEVVNATNYYVSEEAFSGAYVDFITDIKSHYSQSTVICAVGVMMSDYYPAGANHWTRIQNYVTKAVDSLNKQGDEKVHFLKLNPQTPPYGEDWHPTVATQKIMAQTLTSFIHKTFEENHCPNALELGKGISTMGKQLPIIIGQEVEADASVKYQWYKDDVLIEGETNAALSISDNGDYTGVYQLQKDSMFCSYSDEILVTDDYLEVGEIANWADNKKAAVSLTFDDWSNGHPNIAVPQLNKRGIVGTFNITSSFVTNWDAINDAYKAGHEIANHSKSHADISKLEASEYYNEISAPESTIESNIEGLNIATFAYPMGTYNQGIIDTLKALGYVGARGVEPSSQNYTYNFATSEDDYYNILTYPISNSVQDKSFTKQIDNTIKGGGLLTYLYHSVNSPSVTDNNYSAVSESNFERQFDILLDYNDEVWIATMADALKYHRQKNCATLIELSEPTDLTWELELKDTLDDAIYNYPLTIVLPLYGKQFDMIQQNGKNIIIDTVYNDAIQFKAIPDFGTIKLINTGIETETTISPEVFTNTEEKELKITVEITENTNDIVSVVADLSAVGQEAVELIANTDGIYEGLFTIAASFNTGFYKIPVTITDSEGTVKIELVAIQISSGITIDSFIIQNDEPVYTHNEMLEFSLIASDDNAIEKAIIDASAMGLGNALEMELQNDNSFYLALEDVELVAGTKQLTVVVYDGNGNEQRQSYEKYIGKAPITDIQNESFVTIAPNPIHDYIYVNNIEKPFSCQLFDNSGVAIKTEYNKTKIDVSDFPQGMYLLLIKTDSIHKHFKLVKL